MRIGAPREIKTLEFRIGLTPGVAQRLRREGHEVFVEAGAGAGTDERVVPFPGKMAVLIRSAPRGW